MRMRLQERIDGFHQRQLRKVCRVIFPDTIGVRALKTKTGTIEDLTPVIDRRRWGYFGYVMRHEGPPKESCKAYQGMKAAKKRGKGRPKMNLAAIIEKDLRERNTTTEMAANRKEWWDRRTISSVVARNMMRIRRIPEKLKDDIHH